MYAHMKLGRLPAKHDPRNLLMASYLDPSALPAPPASRLWSAKMTADWGMMLNSDLGDCTCAAAGHFIQGWTANNTTQIITPTDDQILAAYEGSCGYNPADPSTDQGGVETNVLDYWRTTGIAGTKIDAYVALEESNHNHIKVAINEFGGAYIGVALPLSAQTQSGIWSATSGSSGEPGSWGGHALYVCDYTEDDLTCVTWGQLKKMTWSFWDKYCQESYALMSQLWAPTSGAVAPSGFDYQQLLIDLKKVTG